VDVRKGEFELSGTLAQVNLALGALSATVLPSLVQVRNGRRGAGAGTIWHADGLIATNAHVVGRGPVAVSLPDGSEHPARLLARDDALDLAFLRVDAAGLPVIPLGDSQQLTPGDVVIAFGHPWGVHGAATSGIVIGMGDRLPELARTGREWLAASLHLRPGHSGGPMVDAQGRLVGINTLMNGPEVGVAIPVHVAKRFLRQTYADQSQATHQPVQL
jgi:S1-C subfamily serine protease